MSNRTSRRRRATAALLLAGVAFGGIGGIAVGLVAVAPAALAQTGWAGTSSPDDLRYRLDILDAELADIRARLGGAAAAPPAGTAGAGVRVTELEGELRRLTAAVEELQHQVRSIGEEAARRFSDIEFRLTELEGGDVSTLEPVPPLGAGSDEPAPPVASLPEPTILPAPVPRQVQAQVQAQAQDPGPTASGPRPSGIVAGPSGQGTFGGIEVPLPARPGEEVAATSASGRGDLERAIVDVRQGRFDQAEDRLRRFLNQHQDSPLRAEAWYWLGESQFVRGEHAEAARSFLNGYNTDRAGARAAHNLYRLGVTLGRLGQRGEACLTLREVRAQFPSAPDGIVEQADAESDALSCG